MQFAGDDAGAVSGIGEELGERQLHRVEVLRDQMEQTHSGCINDFEGGPKSVLHLPSMSISDIFWLWIQPCDSVDHDGSNIW